MKRLAVIDGMSVFYRGYYAMPSLATKDGTPTGGVMGFASIAIEIIKKIQPDYVAIAWDIRGTSTAKRSPHLPRRGTMKTLRSNRPANSISMAHARQRVARPAFATIFTCNPPRHSPGRSGPAHTNLPNRTIRRFDRFIAKEGKRHYVCTSQI